MTRTDASDVAAALAQAGVEDFHLEPLHKKRPKDKRWRLDVYQMHGDRLCRITKARIERPKASKHAKEGTAP